MGDFFNNYWSAVLGIIGILTTPIAWVFGGRAKSKQELKGGDIENEMKEIDYAEKIHDLYEKIIARKDADIENLSQSLKQSLSDAKEDREYFRKEINPMCDKINELEKKIDEQEKQIADLTLRNAITKEAAESWEKKFNELQKEHDQLKKQFEMYKKANK